MAQPFTRTSKWFVMSLGSWIAWGLKTFQRS
jgi:hypothetical protein